MELDQILDKIEERWTSDNNFELIIGLQKAPQGAATGTEGLILICKYIRELKFKNELDYQKIQDLAEELFAYERRILKRT